MFWKESQIFCTNWPYVRIALAIVDEGVRPHPFPLGDGVVGAGVDVNQVEHVVDGLDDPQEVRLLQDGVQPVGELPVGQNFEHPRQPEVGCVDAEDEIELENKIFTMKSFRVKLTSGATTFTITAFSIMTFSIMTLSIIVEYCYDECQCW